MSYSIFDNYYESNKNSFVLFELNNAIRTRDCLGIYRREKCSRWANYSLMYPNCHARIALLISKPYKMFAIKIANFQYLKVNSKDTHMFATKLTYYDFLQ